MTMESIVPTLSKYQINASVDGSLAYWIRNEVSSNDVWDCGILVVRGLQRVPVELRNLLSLRDLDKEVMKLWCELDSLESTTIKEYERNHRELLVQAILNALPQGTITGAASIEDLSPSSILDPFSKDGWVSPNEGSIEGILENLQKSVRQPKSDQKKSRGRPPLTSEEVNEWCRIAKKAIKIKKGDPRRTWKNIASELNVSEGSLRYWRHDPRCK